MNFTSAALVYLNGDFFVSLPSTAILVGVDACLEFARLHLHAAFEYVCDT